MKRLLALAAMVGFMWLASCTGLPTDPVGDIKVVNGTTESCVYELFISDTGINWGSNLLSSVLTQGQEVTFTNYLTGAWYVKISVSNNAHFESAEVSNNAKYPFYFSFSGALNVAEGDVATWTLEPAYLAISNNSPNHWITYLFLNDGTTFDFCNLVDGSGNNSLDIIDYANNVYISNYIFQAEVVAGVYDLIFINNVSQTNTVSDFSITASTTNWYNYTN